MLLFHLIPTESPYCDKQWDSGIVGDHRATTRQSPPLHVVARSEGGVGHLAIR
jgi:hypothetical protein